MVELGGSVLLQELNKVLELTTRLVLDGLLVFAGEEVKSGESLDIKTININLVGGGVHLGDDNTVHGGELGTELIPSGGELLAVSAPGCVKLHKHILVVVHDNVIERSSLENLHIAGSVGRGDLLRLEGGLELAGENSVDVGRDGIGIIEASRVRELLHGCTRTHVNKDKGRELGDAKVLGNLGFAGRHIDGKDLSLQGLGDASELLQKGSMVVSLGIGEK
mmetsp:Transcript_1189/g.2400  ORF Transcript_1189/g.2400 Transcript_1189/m.2400 type:complete len:221 (-) Transcript_1189:900-1562(-)